MGWQPETQPKGKPPVEKTEGAETMQRLIEAQDAFNVLTDYYHHNLSTQHLALQEALNKVPTVDAIPIDYMRSQIDCEKWAEIITRWKEHVTADDKENFPEGFFEKPRRHATKEKGFDEKTCIPVTIHYAVSVKRGMWTFIRLTDKDYGHKAKECSSCGSTFFDTRQWNYCPNCGAYMKGTKDGSE